MSEQVLSLATHDWGLHQLRHTAISLRAAHEYTEVDLKRL